MKQSLEAMRRRALQRLMGSARKIGRVQRRHNHTAVVTDQKKQIEDEHRRIEKSASQFRSSFLTAAWRVHRSSLVALATDRGQIRLPVTEAAYQVGHDVLLREMRSSSVLTQTQVKGWFKYLLPIFAPAQKTVSMSMPWLGDPDSAVVDLGLLSKWIPRLNGSDQHVCDLISSMHYDFTRQGWLRHPETRMVFSMLANYAGKTRLGVAWPTYFCPMASVSSVPNLFEPLVKAQDYSAHKQWLLHTHFLGSARELSVLAHEMSYLTYLGGQAAYDIGDAFADDRQHQPPADYFDGVFGSADIARHASSESSHEEGVSVTL